MALYLPKAINDLHRTFFGLGYFCSFSFMLEAFFRCSMTLDFLKSQMEAVIHKQGLSTEGFPAGLFGWVVSWGNPQCQNL